MLQRRAVRPARPIWSFCVLRALVPQTANMEGSLMKIFEQISDQEQTEIVISLTLEEAQDLHEGLVQLTEPDPKDKKLSKQSRVWKLAHEIAYLMPCW